LAGAGRRLYRLARSIRKDFATRSPANLPRADHFGVPQWSQARPSVPPVAVGQGAPHSAGQPSGDAAAGAEAGHQVNLSHRPRSGHGRWHCCLQFRRHTLDSCSDFADSCGSSLRCLGMADVIAAVVVVAAAAAVVRPRQTPACLPSLSRGSSSRPVLPSRWTPLAGQFEPVGALARPSLANSRIGAR